MNRNALTNKQTNITYIKRILDLVTNIFSFNKNTVLVTKSRILLEKKNISVSACILKNRQKNVYTGTFAPGGTWFFW